METRDKKDDKIEDLEDFRRYIQELNRFLPIAFCVVNPLNYVLEVNKFFQNLFGCDKVEAVGMEMSDLFLEKLELEDFIKRVRQTDERLEREFTLITKKGKPVPARVAALARKSEDEDFSGYLFTIADITKEKEIERKMEAELREKTAELKKRASQMEDSRSALINILEDVDRSYKEAEKERIKTAAIIENFIDGMLFFNSDNLLSIINPKAEDFFQVKRSDIVGRKITDISTDSRIGELVDFITDDDKDEIIDIFREELKFNEDFYLEITTTKIKEEDGLLGVLVHAHDITREKRIERIKSEFVSVAAHQLRTPLSGIKWTLETFLEEVTEEEDKLTEDEISLIKKTYDANERMVRLVNDLLNVSRIEEGRYIYEPEPVDIFELISPILEEHKEIIDEKEGLELRMEKTEENIPRVEVDIEKMRVVLQNLIDNAVKYTDEGQVVVKVERRADKLKISVKDDGIGIPQEQQERLFNKFFRAENVVRKDVEGSGLGLFITKNIVEAHGGEIGFESVEGQGTVFYFTLPIKSSDPENFIRNF